MANKTDLPVIKFSVKIQVTWLLWFFILGPRWIHESKNFTEASLSYWRPNKNSF